MVTLLPVEGVLLQFIPGDLRKQRNRLQNPFGIGLALFFPDCGPVISRIIAHQLRLGPLYLQQHHKARTKRGRQ